MFLVEDRRGGGTYLVFTGDDDDPRSYGYAGVVVERVALDYDMAVHNWPDGTPRPEVCVGRDPNDPKRYKVFKYSAERQAAGFVPVAGTPLVTRWVNYLKLSRPHELPEDEWYRQLDEYDEASRRRRRSPLPEPTAGTPRDGVASWVAKKHLVADASVREVWHLPGHAAADEIRLLEVNDRLPGRETAEALDFGLDVQGTRYRLSVADVSSEQLDLIRHDPSRLPVGWSLEPSQVWRRGT